jgi:hypothetical protein
VFPASSILLTSSSIDSSLPFLMNSLIIL